MNPPSKRFLSQDECRALATRIGTLAHGGGTTDVWISTSWTGNIHWGRNQIDTCGDVRNNAMSITRSIRGAVGVVGANQLEEHRLEAAVRRAERLLIQNDEDPEASLMTMDLEPYQSPALWFDGTYQLDAAARAATMRTLVQPATAAGMLSAGYIEVSAEGQARMASTGQGLYYPVTLAQYSVTVRDPLGTGSGWAGVDGNDWGRIDAAALSAIALDKCLRSRNPVALEPGRYTAILEPQAVCDFVSCLINPGSMDRVRSENDGDMIFAGSRRGETKIGRRLLDERLTISTDPMDPELGFVPFDVSSGDVYHPATWFDGGVLKQLAYNREYAIQTLGLNRGLPFQGAFRMSGGTTSVDEMIATTQRGLLVTRLSGITEIDEPSCLQTGYTRDGLWLIENGKISHPVQNFRFTESPVIALNNVLHIGPPQRVFCPDTPTVVPPLTVKDFNFNTLSDAV